MPDAFEILGLPKAFDLDPAALQRAYLAGAARLHPDMTRGSAGDGELADVSDLNRAKAVLSDPERRAEELLAALGGPAKEADKSLPAGFLMRIMDVRTELDGARQSGDAAAVSRWRSWAQEQRAEFVRTVREMFARAAPPLAEIRRTLNAWRYIERMIEQMDPAYDPNRADFTR